MMYPGMKDRIQKELLEMRPFQSSFQVEYCLCQLKGKIQKLYIVKYSAFHHQVMLRFCVLFIYLIYVPPISPRCDSRLLLIQLLGVCFLKEFSWLPEETDGPLILSSKIILFSEGLTHICF